MDVAIIDYGSGNLRSAHKAFQRAADEAGLSAHVHLTADADLVSKADKIVLPGVGAFADCRSGLQSVDGMIDVLNEMVEKKGTPFFGICVGMQLMAMRGLEKETTEGLGWIKGEVTKIKPSDPSLKIPQIGWNTIELTQSHPLWDGIKTGPDGLHAYFVHSYHMELANPSQQIATTDYGGPVTAMVGQDNRVGTQFHPEKSQALGLALITNFLKWSP